MKNFLLKNFTILIIFLFTSSTFYISFADDYIENNITIDVDSEISEAISKTDNTLLPS